MSRGGAWRVGSAADFQCVIKPFVTDLEERQKPINSQSSQGLPKCQPLSNPSRQRIWLKRKPKFAAFRTEFINDSNQDEIETIIQNGLKMRRDKRLRPGDFLLSYLTFSSSPLVKRIFLEEFSGLACLFACFMRCRSRLTPRLASQFL